MIIETLLSGMVAGLVTWGGIRMEMKYMRRDIDELRQTVKTCRMVHV